MIYPINSRLPFPWANPVGYLVAIFVQGLGLTLGFRFVLSLLSHFIGTFVILASIANDIKQNFINVQLDEQVDELKITRKLLQFIDLHSNAKQVECSHLQKILNNKNEKHCFFIASSMKQRSCSNSYF